MSQTEFKQLDKKRVENVIQTARINIIKQLH